MDQADHGDHNPPGWTRSVQDHLGPRSDIFLMLGAYDSSLGTSHKLSAISGEDL